MERMSKLHLYITLIAALVVTVVSILCNVSLYHMSVWVSVTIVVFYVIGQVVRIYLTNKVFQRLEASEHNAAGKSAVEKEPAFVNHHEPDESNEA